MFGLQGLSFDGQNASFRRADCGFELRWPIAMSHSPIFVLPTLAASSLTIDGGHPGSGAMLQIEAQLFFIRTWF